MKLVVCGAAALAAATFVPHTETAIDEAPPAAMRVDTGHASAIFRIKRGHAFFFGRFDHIEGQVTLDEDNPENNKAEIRIKAESVHTGNQRRDDHLRSADFFDVKQFEWVTFTSSEFEEVEDDIYEVKGELDLHGVKKEITVNAMKTGGDATSAGFEVSFEIDRTDFGIEYGRGGLGDEVTVTLGIPVQAGGGRRRRGGD